MIRLITLYTRNKESIAENSINDREDSDIFDQDDELNEKEVEITSNLGLKQNSLPLLTQSYDQLPSEINRTTRLNTAHHDLSKK